MTVHLLKQKVNKFFVFYFSKFNHFFKTIHCMKSVLIRSFSVPYLPAFGLHSVRMRGNADQKKSEYEVINNHVTLQSMI